jgi:hypothetical protein
MAPARDRRFLALRGPTPVRLQQALDLSLGDGYTTGRDAKDQQVETAGAVRRQPLGEPRASFSAIEKAMQAR